MSGCRESQGQGTKHLEGPVPNGFQERGSLMSSHGVGVGGSVREGPLADRLTPPTLLQAFLVPLPVPGGGQRKSPRKVPCERAMTVWP